MSFAISECFVSPQGEGTYTGRLVIFLRLAGCTVGTRYPKERYTSILPMLPEYTNECHLYDARTFACDTDYRVKQRLEKQEVVELLRTTHRTCDTICITGGEPLMHKDIYELCRYLLRAGYNMHLETSGTIPITTPIKHTLQCFEHIAVSPKLGFLSEYLRVDANVKDIKLLVDEHFDPYNLPEELKSIFLEHRDDVANANLEIAVSNDPIIWLQPVNGEHTINETNLKYCLDLQLLYPHLRISSQAHKSWSVR